MINLFNIDIEKIKHNGDTVLLMKLDGDIIYETSSRTIQYTVLNDFFDLSLAECGLPRIYSDKDNYSLHNYESIVITKLDGSKTNDINTKLSEIKKVKIYYPDAMPIYSINFNDAIYEHHPDVYSSPITSITYMNTTGFISMASIFSACNQLKSVNANNWDTSQVTSMRDMFRGNELTSLDVSNWDTRRVTDMSHMFRACGDISSLDLSSFRTLKVTTMESMFAHCNNLTSLDLSNWDTSNVTMMANMFLLCYDLRKLNLANFVIGSETNVYCMFDGCSNLRELRLDNCDYTTIKKIIESEKFPTNNTNSSRTIYCKEENAVGLELPLGWSFSFVTEDAPGIPETPEPPEIPDDPDSYPLYTVGQWRNNTGTTIKTMVNETHTDLRNMFYKCSNLISIGGIEYWDTSNVITMYCMFYYCTSLTELDLSSFDTSNVTNMNFMFGGCKNLVTLNLSSFDMTNTTTEGVSSMFYECSSLTNLQAPKNINMSIGFSYSPLLTHDSLMSIINNLAKVNTTKTLNLGATNLAKLTDEEKAIAINKGWKLT